MPFKSKAQVRLCYYGGMGNVDCDKWLSETPSVEDLPERVGLTKYTKNYCRKIRKGEKIKSHVYTGPRGGKYFFIYDKVKGKIKSITKVYV